jgi:hypothetical protein
MGNNSSTYDPIIRFNTSDGIIETRYSKVKKIPSIVTAVAIRDPNSKLENFAVNANRYNIMEMKYILKYGADQIDEKILEAKIGSDKVYTLGIHTEFMGGGSENSKRLFINSRMPEF